MPIINKHQVSLSQVKSLGDTTSSVNLNLFNKDLQRYISLNKPTNYDGTSPLYTYQNLSLILYPLGVLINLIFCFWSYFLYHFSTFNIYQTHCHNLLLWSHVNIYIFLLAATSTGIHGIYTRMLIKRSQQTLRARTLGGAYNNNNNYSNDNPSDNSRDSTIILPNNKKLAILSNSISLTAVQDNVWSSLCGLFYLVLSNVIVILFGFGVGLYLTFFETSCSGDLLLNSKLFVIGVGISSIIYAVWWVKEYEFWDIVRLISKNEK